jgi:GrpB-like predicted nucleotidyltransferase (UPF0157 family)
MRSSGGRDVIEIVAYDPERPGGSRPSSLLERVLAPWLAGGIHHIGSTRSRESCEARHRHDGRVRDLDEARATYEPGLAREHPREPGAYTAGKRAFVAQVLAGAGIEPGRR